MTEAELKAIEDRAEKTTPGPWYHYDHGVVVEKDCAAIDEGDLQKVLANGDFIAFARTDVPALCAEVRKLREALEFIAVPGALQTREDWQMKRAREALKDEREACALPATIRVRSGIR